MILPLRVATPWVGVLTWVTVSPTPVSLANTSIVVAAPAVVAVVSSAAFKEVGLTVMVAVAVLIPSVMV